MSEMSWEELCKLISESGVKLSFSINCHSGLASLLGPDHLCGCWRCRESRGEEWDEETEYHASLDSMMAQSIMRERMKSGRK